MKKLLTSAIAIIALSTVVVGASWAYFSDQEKVEGNTFGSGKIVLDVRGPVSQSVHLENMEPGIWTSPMELDVYNTSESTMSVKYRFYDEKVDESIAGFYNKLNVKVRHTFAGTPNPGGWPVVYEGKLKDLIIESPTTAGIISPSLGVNITHVYYFEFELAPETGNEFQGATGTFDLIFDATQTNNPGW